MKKLPSDQADAARSEHLSNRPRPSDSETPMEPMSKFRVAHCATPIPKILLSKKATRHPRRNWRASGTRTARLRRSPPGCAAETKVALQPRSTRPCRGSHVSSGLKANCAEIVIVKNRSDWPNGLGDWREERRRNPFRKMAADTVPSQRAEPPFSTERR